LLTLKLKNYLMPIAQRQKHSYEQCGGDSTQNSSGTRQQERGLELVIVHAGKGGAKIGEKVSRW